MSTDMLTRVRRYTARGVEERDWQKRKREKGRGFEVERPGSRVTGMQCRISLCPKKERRNERGAARKGEKREKERDMKQRKKEREKKKSQGVHAHVCNTYARVTPVS